MGIRLTPQERFEIFGDFNPEEHAAEVDQRWGDTQAHRESQRRVASYTADDWRRFKTEMAAVEQSFAAALRDGVPAESEQARTIAELHRQHLNKWCYDCDYQMHRGLGQLYVSDPRFTAYYDGIANGLAQYVADAIASNADASEVAGKD